MSEPKYIARSPRVAARMIGDELMIMSGRDSTLFALNDTAAAIWQAADGVTPLHEIVEDRVCSVFDVDLATAVGDANELVEQLAGHGVLLLSDAPSTGEMTMSVQEKM